MTLQNLSRAEISGASKYLTEYVTAFFPLYEAAPHHIFISEKLEAVERGEITRLILTVPPQHGKSTLCSEYLPPWFLGRNPSRRIISATYSMDKALDWGRSVKEQLSSELFRQIFPGCKLKGNSVSNHKAETTERGHYFAVGVGGPITGRGSDLFIIDDPYKDDNEVRSKAHQTMLQRWYKAVVNTRLAKNGAVIILLTRWNEADIAGWLLKEMPHEKFTLINLPAIAEKDDPLNRVPGQALWESKFPLDDLENKKRTSGAYYWSAMYQGRPAPEGGGLIKKEWFKYYSVPPQDVVMRVISLDTAQKASELNDYSVATVWDVTRTHYYLRAVYRDRMEYPALKRFTKSLCEKHQPHAILIEDKSSGSSLIQELRDETRWAIIAINPENDKVTRASTVSAQWESGKVLHPEVAPWLVDYEAELITFPSSAHKDQVDSTTQFLNWSATATGGRAQIVGLRH